MRKFIFGLLILGCVFLASTHSALAFQKESYMSLTYPVRELTPDLKNPQTTTELPDVIFKLSTPSAMPVTWLLQYDVVKSSTDSAFFEALKTEKTQELGLLIETTPKLLKDSNLPNSNSLLLNSFPPQDREKIIDQAFSTFFKRFGFYPQTVAGEYIDSLSLEYMTHKYTVKSAVLAVSQNPQVSSGGVFEYFPYFPSRLNTLVPAQNQAEKLPITLVHWNTPSLISESRLNLAEQQKLSQTKNGFADLFAQFSQKDLNEFTYLTFGVDNNTPIAIYKPVLTNILQTYLSTRDKFTLHPQTNSQFGEWLLERYPDTSPAYFYQVSNTDQTNAWYQNPFYQIQLKSDNGKTKIVSLTVFDNIQAEDYRFQYNQSPKFTPKYQAVIITDQPVTVDFDISKAKRANDYWELTLTSDNKVFQADVHQIKTTGFTVDFPQSVLITHSKTAQTNYYLFSNNLQNSNSGSNLLVRSVEVIILLLIVLSFLKLPPSKLFLSVKKNLILGLTVLVGSFFQLATTLKSGSLTDYGLSFWGPNGHDAFVHLALIENFKKSVWPLINPTFTKSPLVNYHIIYDVFTSFESKISGISSLNLYFRINPLLMSLSIGLLVIWLTKQWKWSRGQIFLSLLLVYFAGSLGFIVTLIKSHHFFAGESIFWSTQSISLNINPPLVLSIVGLLLFINLLNLWQNKFTINRILVLSLIGGLLIQTKAYSGILLILGLFLVLIGEIRSHTTNLKPLILIFLGVSFISLFAFLPTYKQSGSLFVFQPLWFLRTMFEATDRIGWRKIADAWMVYEQTHSLVKLTILQLGGLLIFFIGNLGIRILGIKNLLINTRQPSLTKKLISYLCILGLFIPILFIQTSNPWNSIQFIYYSLFFLAILAGPAILNIFQKTNTIVGFSFCLLILVLGTIPTTVGTLRDYFSPIPASVVTSSELRALDILRSQPSGLVLTSIYNTDKARRTLEPKPMWAYTSTAYVSALSGQPSFLSDEINLAISDYHFNDQKRDVQRFFLTSDKDWMKFFLTENNIRYVYLTADDQLMVDPEQLNLYPLFSSPSVNLYTYRP